MKCLNCFMCVLLLVVFSGCDKDARLANLAERTAQELARQNERSAHQTQQIAEASKRLIEADSQSRRDLVTAQRDLQGDVSQERRIVDERLDALENERRRVALERQQAPVIAEGVLSVGTALICLLPLGLCLYLLRYLLTSHEPAVELGNLLAEDLLSDSPKLMGHKRSNE